MLRDRSNCPAMGVGVCLGWEEGSCVCMCVSVSLCVSVLDEGHDMLVLKP